MKLVLLVSGNLGKQLLQYLYQLPYDISGVFTDKRSEDIYEFCKEKNLNCYVGNPRKEHAKSFINSLSCDVLLSINYLFIIEKNLIQLPTKFSINFHGSLLPKYRGRTPHVWAIINGEQETGVTAHLINEKLDDGPIVHQIRIPINQDDTGADILNKFHGIYPNMVKEVLNRIENNGVVTREQNEFNATYFGKRTPEDGRINWGWGKERIRNWIRAQASPYPGAFTYWKESKIIIHKAAFSDLGFHAEQENGTVLDVDKDALIVKTPNGALRIMEMEWYSSTTIKIGEILK